MTAKNDHLNQKYVDGLVATAIRSSVIADNDVKMALAFSIKMAASEVGRFEPLNRLFQGVPNGMAENIRQFFVNMVRHTGITVKGENGQERKVGFFKFSAKDRAFSHPKAKTDETKAHREIIDAMSIEDLMAFVLGPEKRETVEQKLEKDLEDFEQAIARTVKRFFNEGVITQAMVDRFNGLLTESQRVDVAQLQKAEDEKIARALKTLQNAGHVVRLDDKKVSEPVNVNRAPEPHGTIAQAKAG